MKALVLNCTLKPSPETSNTEALARVVMGELETGGAPLRLAAAADQSGLLQHLQMFRHGRQAHVERLGQIVDAGLALGQPRQDGPTGRIGERGELGGEGVGLHLGARFVCNCQVK